MRSFTRVAFTSCLAGTALALGLPVSVALAVKMGTSSQTEIPCGPVALPHVLLPHGCGVGGSPACAQWKSLVKGERTYTCCVQWHCVLWHPPQGKGKPH